MFWKPKIETEIVLRRLPTGYISGDRKWVVIACKAVVIDKGVWFELTWQKRRFWEW